MRRITVLLLTLTLAGCSMLQPGMGGTAQPVDPATLPPLSSREQSLLLAADGAFQQGNHAAAERDYLAAVGASKGHVEAHLALVHFYEKTNQPHKQHEILERARTWQPRHPLVNYLLGKYYLSRNDYPAARKAFQEGRATLPMDGDLLIGEAIAQDMLGNHTRAQSLYQQALQGSTPAVVSVARTNLAMSYLLGNEAQKAVDLLEPHIKQPETTAVARHNLALAYGMLDRHKDAKALLKGDVDEATRVLAIARLKAYHQDHSRNPGLTPQLEPGTKDGDKKPVKQQ